MKKNSYMYHAGTSFFFYFAFACYNAMLALYLSDIHFNAQQISLITSSAPLFSIFAQPYLGTLADRFRSPRKVSLVALFITVVMNMIFMKSRQYQIFVYVFVNHSHNCLNTVYTIPISRSVITIS